MNDGDPSSVRRSSRKRKSTNDEWVEAMRQTMQQMEIRTRKKRKTKPFSGRLVQCNRIRRQEKQNSPDEVAAELNLTVELNGKLDFREMVVECNLCDAKHWIDERLTRLSKKNPEFGN